MKRSMKMTKHLNKRNAAVLWSMTAVLMVVIFYFSSLEDTELAGGFLSFIFEFFSNECPIPILSLFIDKLFHAGIYGLLGLLFYLSLRESGIYRHLFLLSVVLAVGYGVTDEFHQSFVPGRFASAGDLLADLAGALIGGLAAGILVSVRNRRSV